MLKPEGGFIELDGQPITHGTQHRRRLGFVAQAPRFYDWMTVERVGSFVSGFYPTWSDDAFGALLEQFLLHSRRRVGLLSEGKRRQLALALALAHRPALLILDEPTSGIDKRIQESIHQALHSEVKNRGLTVLYCTSDIAEVAQLGGFVGMLHQGHLWYQGPVTDIGQWVRFGGASPPAGAVVLRCDEEDRVAIAPPWWWERHRDCHYPTSLEQAYEIITQQGPAEVWL